MAESVRKAIKARKWTKVNKFSTGKPVLWCDTKSQSPIGVYSKGLCTLSRKEKAGGNIWGSSWWNWRNHSVRESALKTNKERNKEAHRQNMGRGFWEYSWKKNLRVGNGKEVNGGILRCYAMDLDIFLLVLVHHSQEPHTLKGETDRWMTDRLLEKSQICALSTLPPYLLPPPTFPLPSLPHPHFILLFL